MSKTMAEQRQNWTRINTGTGLLFWGGLLVLALLAILPEISHRLEHEGFLVKAEFGNIGDLRTGAPVKIGGMKVGEVTQLTLQDNMNILIIARLSLNQPLPIDSIMSVESTTISGDTYVSISRGLSLKTISPKEAIKDAVELKGSDFFSFGGIGVLAADIGDLAKILIGDVNDLRGQDGFFSREFASIKKESIELKEQYDLLSARITKTQPIIKEMSAGFQSVSVAWEKISHNAQKGGIEQATKEMLQNIEIITRNRDELNAVRILAREETESIRHDISIISSWLGRFNQTGKGPLAILMSSGCAGLPQTLTTIHQSMEKVSDLSLLRKLKFYFNAQDLWEKFLENTPASFALSADMLYGSWAKSQFIRRSEELRQSHTACEILKK